jgi:hypothetical protein
MRVLIVKSAFGGFEKGSRITDPDAITAILASEQKVHVVASEHEDLPVELPKAPAPKTEDKP